MCGDRFISCLLDVHIIPKTTLRQSVLDSHFNHPPSCTDIPRPVQIRYCEGTSHLELFYLHLAALVDDSDALYEHFGR